MADCGCVILADAKPVGYRFKLTALGETKSINPFDFKLRDAAGVAHEVTFSDAPGCDTWSAVDLAAGARYEPKPLCFEASGASSGKLTLLVSRHHLAAR